jgi:hypothetical protein
MNTKVLNHNQKTNITNKKMQKVIKKYYNDNCHA